MSMDGRVVLINQETQLAVVDLGMNQALVVHFDNGSILYEGDLLERLSGGYRTLRCVNRTKNQELCVLVLSDAMPMSLAVMVVTDSHRCAA